MPPPPNPFTNSTPPYAPMRMLSAPGIQRDGTRLANVQYIEGEWCRFYQNLPRKMLGVREQLRNLDGITRALDVESYDGFSYVHAGQQDVLQRYYININSGLASGLIDRTPVGFMASDNNNWQFTIMYDTANDANLIFAHAAPNILDIANTEIRSIYYGEVRDTAALLELTPTDPADIAQVSGGVVAIWPYLVRYGQDGFVGWSKPGEPLTTSGTGSGTARPSGTKIIRGLPLRGTSGPACLLWSLDSLVRMQFVGGTAIFLFDTITTSSSPLSSNAIIEHEGVYYWPTTTGFYSFNGVLREVKNDDNCQYFLDNLNYAQRQKVFAMKIPRWGEIWFCFPSGNNTECDQAVILNYREGFWYDTRFPNGSTRSAGMYEQVYHYPIMTSAVANQDNNGYSSWQHEFGFDEISGAVPQAKAIRSLIQTGFKSLVVPEDGGRGTDRSMTTNLLEPDFDQSGDLMFSIESKQNARAQSVVTDPVIIPTNPTPQEELTKVKHTGRLVSYIIESNAAGGNYIFGTPLVHTTVSDGRRED
jgi:hypothetical protein